MSDMMTFPDTWEEFEKLYGFNDVEEIYTNNSRLIPSFRVKQWLDHLPSVQPELSNNSPELDKEIGELISREEAIKAVKFYETFCDPYPRVIEALEELPSAQPERTCVNCGRTANNGGWYADGGTRCPIEEHYALPKDGYCHLWEKRNVTDDDYLERRTDDKINKGSSC